MKKTLLIFGVLLLAGTWAIFNEPESPSADERPRDPAKRLPAGLSDRDIIYSARHAVKRFLKVPSSAEFPPWPDGSYGVIDLENNTYVVTGQVTAKNAFGVDLQSDWQARIKFSGPRLETVNVSEVKLDEKIVYNAP